MLTIVDAIRFERPAAVGRTKPCIITCLNDNATEVELVVKFSAGCESGHRSLINEVLAAVLAHDLALPVPEPFLVNIERDFAQAIPNAESKQLAMASLGCNFGSKKLPNGFRTIVKESPVPEALLQTALEIIAFDTFLANDDRSVDNPNLLTNGQEYAIFDHELALMIERILFWKAPWQAGSINLSRSNFPGKRHIFSRAFSGKMINLDRFAQAFKSLSNNRLSEYRTMFPDDWLGDGQVIDKLLDYLTQLRDNIDMACQNLKGALQ